MDYEEDTKPICPDGYPYCLDPEIMKIGDIGLDPTLDDPIVLDDYRINKSKEDITYISPEAGIPDPPTKRSIQDGINRIFDDTTVDDDPKNAWLYQNMQGPFVSIVRKYEWGGVPAKIRTPLKFPVTNVRFHQTNTDTDKLPECMEIIDKLQIKYLKEGLSDIPYNFLIGSDGQMYEGRGWYVDSERSPDDPNLRGNCLEIAYIGTFKGGDLPWEMVEMGLDAIRYGIEANIISPLHKVLPMIHHSNTQ